MIAALWSNSNWDDDKQTRQNAIAELEEHYDEAVQRILGTGAEPEEEAEIEDKYGFFAAGERGLKKIEAPRNTDGTVQEAVSPNHEYSEYIDQ